MVAHGLRVGSAPVQVQTTSLEGVLLFVPTPFRDERGFFSRTFDAADARAVGLDPDAFVQDSQSRSARGVVRGMHGRRGGGEAKLVRCAHGAILDVVVDARAGSPTFGQVATFRLDDETLHTLYIPRGFLHGFQALTDTADTCYRIDAPHDPSEDVAVAFDDPELAIAWPLPPSMVSDRDRAAGSWAQARRLLAPAHA
jgi:dTDP-4-dehydrorhamnose 3,5-epimerase